MKITVTATDKEAEITGTDGKSGIRGYTFSKDGGSSWTEEQTSKCIYIWKTNSRNKL